MQNCKRCGNQRPRNNKVFCGVECHKKWMSETAAFYNKKCELCGATFSGGSILKDVRFCSSKCSHDYVNQLKRQNAINVNFNRFRACPVCDIEIPYSRAKRYNLRCSLKCDGIWKSRQIVEAWLKDSSKGTAKGGGLNRTVRRHLIEQAQGRCSKCNRVDVHETTGNYVIEVDHIDGNRFNNRQDNLAVLCGNCHALTQTYKANSRSSSGLIETVKTSYRELMENNKSVVNWLEDDSIFNNRDFLNRSVRDYLIAKADYKCSKCSWGQVNPHTGRIPLEINHIDGNAHNNSKDNLEVLCPQCHGCTPNHRALNKNSSRVGRKKNN
jgi:hypothetical protein